MNLTRYISSVLLAVLVSVGAHATVVVDAATGMPLPRAMVADRYGNSVGVCSDSGVIPSMSAVSYPLTVRYMGYQAGTVTGAATDTLRLEETVYNLPEVTVIPKKRPVLHLTGYVRERSKLTTAAGDTVELFREKTVDFMLPGRGAGRYKGWSRPRVLATRSYYRFTDAYGLDSVSDRYSRHFSWSDWVGIVRQVPLPLSMRVEGNAVDTVKGHFGASAVWRRAGDNVHASVDVLSDTLNRRWTPGFGVYLDGRVDFTRFNLRYIFTDVGESSGVMAENIARVAYDIESDGMNRTMNRLSTKDEAQYMDTYAELYVTDRQFLTVGEAKKWENDPPRGDAIGIHVPEDAAPLEPELAELVSRVESIDHTGRRIAERADRRLAGENYRLKHRKKHGVLSQLKSLIFH